MLKNIILTFVMLLGTQLLSADSTKMLKNIDFKKGFQSWRSSSKKAFFLTQLDGGTCLGVKGIENDPKNRYLRCIQGINLNKEQFQNQEFIFGAEIKAQKITGRFDIAVREIGPNGKSVRYSRITLKTRDIASDWKKLTCSFKPSPRTVKLAFYILAFHLGADDQIAVRNIFFKKNVK